MIKLLQYSTMNDTGTCTTYELALVDNGKGKYT